MIDYPGVTWIQPLAIANGRASGTVRIDLNEVNVSRTKTPDLGDEWSMRAVDLNEIVHYFNVTVVGTEEAPGRKVIVTLACVNQLTRTVPLANDA